MKSGNLNLNLKTTVHELAIQLRQGRCAKYGEAHFAKAMLLFDEVVEGDVRQVLAVLKVAEPHEARFQYAVCWLDGKGHGNSSFLELMASLRG